MSRLWGGHDECVHCKAAPLGTDFLCQRYQRKGHCPAKAGYAERLERWCHGSFLGERTNKVPRFNEGRALMMWVHSCENKRLLSHEETAAIFLQELAETIGMTPIAGPYSLTFNPPAHRPQDAGVSVVLIIEESHLAIHTFPEQEGGAAQLTIVSCKDFDPQEAKDFIAGRTLSANSFSIDLGGSQGFFVSGG